MSVSFCLACLIPAWSAAGQPSWTGALSAGGDGYTLANAIKPAPGGGYYVTGQFSSKASFSGTPLTSRGGADIFLARYDPSAKLLWILTAGGAGDDIGRSLDFDAQGNIYLTGWFSDTGTFDSTNHAPKTVYGNGYTIFLAKYSPDGNLAWVQTGTIDFAGDYNFGEGVAVDASANTVYIAALSQGNTTFSSENGTVSTIAGGGGWHMVVAQYGSDGNFRWGQTDQASGIVFPTGSPLIQPATPTLPDGLRTKRHSPVPMATTLP